MKVRNRVESEASKDAEMGMKAGILGPDPGFNPGKGSMNITESVTSPFFGNDVAPKQIWVENSNESSNNERRMCLKHNNSLTNFGNRAFILLLFHREKRDKK